MDILLDEIPTTLAAFFGSNIALMLLIFSTVFVTVMGLSGLGAARKPMRQRLGQSADESGTREALHVDQTTSRWLTALSKLEKHMMGRPAQRSALRLRLLRAGFTNPNTGTVFFAMRAALAAALPGLFLTALPLLSRELTLQNIMLTAAALGVAGLYLPSLYVSHRISERRRLITEEFPDALDMLVICTEAGLGLDATFTRVGSEIAPAHPVLAEEFGMVSLEMRAGRSRQEALHRMAERSGLPQISSFVTILIQSESLGTSIAQTLRVVADDMRIKRMLRAEEKAYKLPVKLSVPLVVCILPTMMAVVMLPAIVGIVRVLLPSLNGG